MAKVTVTTPTGSGSETGLTYGDSLMFSSGLTMARQRQSVFVGADNQPYFFSLLYGQGNADNVDEVFVEKPKDGRNFVSDRVKSGESTMINGTLIWRYPVMKHWLPNVMGAAKSVTRVDEAFEADGAGTLRKIHFEYPRVGAPLIELWDFWYGTAELATKYTKVRTRSFDQSGSRGGDAGDITGSIEMQGGEPDVDVTFPGLVAANAVQRISISGATGGTLKVTVKNPDGDSAQTAALAYNISASALQTALQGLSNVGSGQLTVSGTTPYVVTAGGTFANKALPTLEVDASLLTGDDVTVTVTVTTAGSDGLGPKELGSKPISIDDKKVYLARASDGVTADEDLATIDFSDPDDAHLLGTTSSSFNAAELWNNHWTENGSRYASNFIAGAVAFTASITEPRGTPNELWLKTNADSCVAEKFWLVFKEQCGTDALLTYIYVSRSASVSTSNDNDVYQGTYELAVTDHDSVSPFQMDVIESWANPNP